MSTLEERREARRRRRQQEEEDDVNDQVTSPDQETAFSNEKRRQEREERLQRIAAGYNTINGEDELERRRRERREQRLRSGSTETPSEDSSSRRSRRRRGTEDDIDTTTTEEVSSYRSRRRRGQEEEETDSAPAPVSEPVSNDTEEEDRRRQQEAEEEAERQAAEAARRRAQEEEEAREREEQERRRREEEERRQEEERRRRDKTYSDTESESDTISSMESDKMEKVRVDQEQKIDEQLKRLKNLEKASDLLLEEEEVWSKTSNGIARFRRKSDERGKILSPKEPGRRSVMEYSLRAGEDGKCEKLKSFFEEKKGEHVNGDQTEMSRSLNFNKKSTIGSPDEDKSPVHEKLRKFETHQQPKDQESKKDISVYHARVISPGTARLKDIQKKFEDKSTGSTENSSSRLGRFSVSESFLNEKPIVMKDSKKHILDRWQSVIETKKSLTKSHSMLSKSMSTSYEFDLHKKGDNIGKLTSKFDHNRNEKPVKIIKSATLPLSTNKDISSLMKQWSVTAEDSSKCDAIEERDTNRHCRSNVMERWRHQTPTSGDAKLSNTLESEFRIRPKSASCSDRTVGNPLDCNSPTQTRRPKSSSKLEEEERLERERLEAEEREREEAARIMEEQQKKKKGKRKGLGGLSPEKKKMLKDDEYSSSEEEEDPYYTFINERSKFWNADKARELKQRIKHIPGLDSMEKGDLVKLCKQLHQQLSKLEEEVYDWEVKIRKQDQEIIQLTLKVNDSKGKFAKPVLKKVNKTESKLNKIASKKDKSDFRDNLKSSGQSKYTLDEEGGESAE